MAALAKCSNAAMVDPLVEALKRLVQREGGHDAVGAEAGHSKQAIYQIVSGVILPSGKPRGVGRLLRERLDRRYPDWLTGVDTGNWTHPQHAAEGVGRYTVDQDLSHKGQHTGRAPDQQVPVIGTLAAGANSMLQLKASPDGGPIGHVMTQGATSESYALQVFGDDMHPAVRHGTVLVVEPGGPCVPGELVLLEMAEGYHMLCELVSLRDDSITVLPAIGGSRQTLARNRVQAVLPIAASMPSWKMRAPANQA